MIVNYERGSDTTNCGQQQSPCKTLHKTVEKIPNGGTITIYGEQPLDKTIAIKKSFTIRGAKDATIVRGSSPTVKFHAFELYDFELHVKFMFLRVIGLGFIKHNYELKNGKISITIEILNCHFRNGIGSDRNRMGRISKKPSPVTRREKRGNGL